jgi:hypothetical protein
MKRGSPSHQVGAVFLEALAAVPFLAAVLAGVIALGGMYSAKMEAKARARRLVWLQADSGVCPAEACATATCAAAQRELRDGGIDALGSVRGGGRSLGGFVGNLGRFLVGSVTRTQAGATATVPRRFRGGQTTQTGRMTLLCNTTAEEMGSEGTALEQACKGGLERTEYAREVCK